MAALRHQRDHWAAFVPLALSFLGTTSASAQIVDQGLVVVDPSNNLRIGIDAFGQREITNAIDGPYSGITLGEAVGGDGHLVLGQGGSLAVTGEMVVGLPTGGAGYVQLTDGATLSTVGARVMSVLSALGPEVIVSDTGTTWSNMGVLRLGGIPWDQSPSAFARGRMNVVGGALAETAGLVLYDTIGSSRLKLSDPGTQFVNTGNTEFVEFPNRGQIAVLDGASYWSPGWLNIYSYSTGLQVIGPGSAFEVDNAIIGGFSRDGDAALEVGGGGHFITGDAQVLSQETVRVRITDPGSHWTANGDLTTIGMSGAVIIEISNGAEVTSESAFISGDFFTRVGISGSASRWTGSGSLTIGEYTRIAYNGSGINVTLGGVLSFDGTVTINEGGFVMLDDSKLDAGRDLILTKRDEDAEGRPRLIASGAQIDVARHFTYERNEVSEVALGDSILTMAGGDAYPGFSFHGMEVGGLDATNACGSLLDDNFGIGRLVVGQAGTPTTVGLYDAMDNGHRNGPAGSGEALYLFGGGGGSRCGRSTDGLVMEPGSVLELNRINTYVYDAALGKLVHLNAQFPGSPNPNEISMFGGTIRLVPEPSLSIGLIAGGAVLAAMASRASKR